MCPPDVLISLVFISSSLSKLDVWSRHLVEQVWPESAWVGRPCLADGFIGREAPQGLQAAAKVVGDDEVGQMGTKLCVAIVMIALGARRDVLAEGVSCGLRRIERIMRANALRAPPGLPKDEGERAAASPDLLERRFAADAPNRKWIADFTSIWTAEGWLDVAAVIDLFSRRVVGWSMQASMTAQRVTDALVMAIWRRGKPDALLHHSDQGSHYTSEACQRLMAEHGVTCSMKRAFHSTSFTSRRCRASLRSRVPSDVKIMLRPMAATPSLGTRRR